MNTQPFDILRVKHSNVSDTVQPTIVRQMFQVDFCFRNVDDVHNLMDEVAEQQEIANEISDAISNPIGFGQDVDEVRLPILSSELLIKQVFHCLT